MTWINSPRGRRLGVVAKWLAVLALPAALIVGCADDDPQHVLLVTTSPDSSASAACAKLAGCGQCFINQTGQCISTTDCAPRLGTDVAICINAANGCGPNTLGDCVFPGCDGNDPTGACE